MRRRRLVEGQAPQVSPTRVEGQAMRFVEFLRGVVGEAVALRQEIRQGSPQPRVVGERRPLAVVRHDHRVLGMPRNLLIAGGVLLAFLLLRRLA